MGRSLKRMAGAGLDIIRREIDFHRYRPASASLEMTNVCNLRCVMCDFGRVRYTNKGELTRDEWKTAIDGLVGLGVRWMNFIGAEPLVRKTDVIALARHLDGRGVHRQLNTNGTIMNPALAEEVIDHFETVIVSIDAPREKHDQIRGQPWAFERTAEGLKMILEARRRTGRTKPRLTIHTTLLNLNHDVIGDMVQQADELEVDSISFQYVSETSADSVRHTTLDGQVIASDRYVVGDGETMLFNADQVRAFRQTLREVQRKPHRAQVMLGLLPHLTDEALMNGVYPVKKCYFTRNKLVVTPQGQVHICSHLDYAIGNVREQPIEQIWGNDKHRRLTATLAKGLLPVCKSCCHHGSNLTPSQYVQLARGRFLG